MFVKSVAQPLDTGGRIQLLFFVVPRDAKRKTSERMVIESCITAYYGVIVTLSTTWRAMDLREVSRLGSAWVASQ